MIHVIATIELKPNSKEAYLNVLRNNLPSVKAEKGCLAYDPVIDIDWLFSNRVLRTRIHGSNRNV